MIYIAITKFKIMVSTLPVNSFKRSKYIKIDHRVLPHKRINPFRAALFLNGLWPQDSQSHTTRATHNPGKCCGDHKCHVGDSPSLHGHGSWVKSLGSLNPLAMSSPNPMGQAALPFPKGGNKHQKLEREGAWRFWQQNKEGSGSWIS